MATIVRVQPKHEDTSSEKEWTQKKRMLNAAIKTNLIIVV